MTESDESTQRLLEHYRARVDGPAGDLWESLLSATPQQRAHTLARCAEPGWVDPSGVAYLARLLELDEGAGWDDVTRGVRDLIRVAEAAAEREDRRG